MHVWCTCTFGPISPPFPPKQDTSPTPSRLQQATPRFLLLLSLVNPKRAMHSDRNMYCVHLYMHACMCIWMDPGIWDPGSYCDCLFPPCTDRQFGSMPEVISGCRTPMKMNTGIRRAENVLCSWLYRTYPPLTLRDLLAHLFFLSVSLCIYVWAVRSPGPWFEGGPASCSVKAGSWTGASSVGDMLPTWRPVWACLSMCLWGWWFGFRQLYYRENPSDEDSSFPLLRTETDTRLCRILWTR